MTQTKRFPQFELLRSVAMLMVVTMHYLANTGLLPELAAPLAPGQVLGTFLEAFCIVAVNVYILISGYFMVQSGFKVSRLIRLLAQVLFYALLIPPVLLLLGLPVTAGQEGLYGLIRYVLPISTGHYWFATEYVLLYLFSPFLNLACQKISKKQFATILSLLLFFYCGLKSVVPVMLATDRQGYDFGWFICLYLTGGYIRLYGLPFLEKGRRGWLIYSGGAMGIGLLTLGLHFLYRTKGWLEYYFNVLFHYNYILVYLAAVGLFYGFKKLRFKEGNRLVDRLARLGSLSFGVYLLHMHMDIRDRWYQWTTVLLGGLYEAGSENIYGLLLNIIVTVLLVYLIGIGIDYFRSKIFKIMEKAGRSLWKSFTLKQ